MPAIAVHHTATTDEPWDASAAVAAMPNDAATLSYCHAWKSADAGDEKGDYKFPHAKTKGGPANLAACRNGLARLSGADIPDGDRAGVKAHLQAHIDDGEKSSHARRPRLEVASSLDVLREHRSAMQAARGVRERRRQSFAEARPAVKAAFEFRANPDSASGPSFHFTGYAATFEQPFEMWDAWGDPYFEVLAAGSCARTLNGGADVQFLVGHDETGLPMARTRSGTMTLSADSTGLLVVAPSLDGRNPQVQQLASAMERGDADEMSIGFIAMAQQWSPDWMERRLTEINLNRGDVSVVCWAANPNAAGATGSWSMTVPAAAARAAGNREQRMPTAPYTAAVGEDNECPQCRSMNDRDASFCDQCGTRIQPTGQSNAEESETQYCPCGNWNAADAKFCDACGELLASDQDADNGGDMMAVGYWARERRADGEPDMSAKPPHDTSAHGPGSLVCPNGPCARGNAPDAAYCDQCGTALYDEGGLIKSNGSLDDVITDASGIVEESDMTLARMRVRVLALRR